MALEYRMKQGKDTEEELYKKDLHNPDNCDGVITHLEPDILDYKVKWALVSIFVLISLNVITDHLWNLRS